MKIGRFLSLFQSAEEKNNQKLQEYMQSYHYQRGVELHNQGRDGDAFEEFKLELDEHPENGMAHLQIADIHLQHNVLGTALKASNNALEYLKQTGNSEFLSQIYYVRGRVYRALEEKDNWFSDIKNSLYYRSNSVDALGELGDYYFYSGDYDTADIQYNRIIDLEPHNPYGYMGRGRNDQGRNEHKAAISHFEKASQLDSDYSAAFSFKAESLLALGKKSEAMDSVITAFCIYENDPKIRDVMVNLARTDLQGLCLKLKAKALQNQDNDSWYRLIGWLCAGNGDIKQAIIAYRNAYKISASPELCDFIAFCWSEIGAYDKAIEEETVALNKVPQSLEFKEKLSAFKAETGQLNDAIKETTEIIDQQPDNQRLYFNRGRYYFELGDYENAVKDFDSALSLQDNKALTLLYKGWALSENHQEKEATQIWQSIVEKEEILEDTQYALPLALYFLDYNDEAVAKCNTLVLQADQETNHHVHGNFYLYAAALYCRTQNIDKALECLKKSIDSYSCRLWFIQNGKLLKPLAECSEFAEFMSAIIKQKEEEKCDIIESIDDIIPKQLNSIKAEIPFVREGKMCKVKCEINDLPLHFIFDTGASDVTMSSVEATFMLKNGYLCESDLSGKQYYRTADGSIAEGVKVSLRNVKFAGLTLSNVKAGIVTNQSAPLLLGQSVLERLGRIEIDNDNMLIRING